VVSKKPLRGAAKDWVCRGLAGVEGNIIRAVKYGETSPMSMVRTLARMQEAIYTNERTMEQL